MRAFWIGLMFFSSIGVPSGLAATACLVDEINRLIRPSRKDGPAQALAAFRDRQIPQLKFVLDPKSRTPFFIEPGFSFHSDPFVLHALNGGTIPGLVERPLARFKFANLREAAEYYADRPLPGGLSWRGAGEFKLDAFEEAVRKGELKIGSLVNSSERSGMNVAAIEFDQRSVKSPAELKKLFDRASAQIGGPDLKWKPNGPAQEAWESKLRKDPAWRERTVGSAALLAGESASLTYCRGSATGRLKYFPEGKYDPVAVRPEDIIVVEDLPNDLPPVRGVISLVPQTPQAHTNMLTLGQNIPNAYLQDAARKAELIALAKKGSAIELTAAEDSIHWKVVADSRVQPDDVATIVAKPLIRHADYPVFASLKTLLKKGIDDARVVGGKARGMMQLLRAKVRTPVDPSVVTTRVYRELIDSHRPWFEKVLTHPRFRGDPKLRAWALEGIPAGQEKEARKLLVSLTASDDPLRAVIEAGGFRGVLRNAREHPTVRKAVAQIEAQYPISGPNSSLNSDLRLRSSADTEDAASFNAAGLYESFRVKTKGKLRTAEITDALLDTFASYWRFPAFEWRTRIGIDHLSSDMGVLVHPSAAAKAPKANGVITISLKRTQSMPEMTQVRMTVNARKGDTSVVRPDAKAGTFQTIEVDVGLGSGPGARDTMLQYDSDGKLIPKKTGLQIFESAKKILHTAFDDANAKLLPEGRYTSWTEDLEFVVDENLDVTFVQARPLVPKITIPSGAPDLPLPPDLWKGVVKIDRRIFETESLRAEVFEVYDPLSTLETAFNPQVTLHFKTDVLDFKAGSSLKILHSDCERITHGDTHHGPWDINLTLKPDVAEKLGFQHLDLFQRANTSIFYTNDGRQLVSRAPFLGRPVVETVFPKP